jgi:hypothetical protein
VSASRKKIGFAVVFALVLIGVAWFLVFRTASTGKQPAGESGSQSALLPEPPSSPVAVGSIGIPGAVPTAVASPQMAPAAAALPVPALQPQPAPDPAVMDVISGDLEAEKDVFKEPYIKRSRPIAINPEILEKGGKLASGSRLNLTLFPDAKYSVTLQQVTRGLQGDLSVSGKLDGEEYGTFVLSAAGGVVLVRLADPTARKLFLIRCHGPDRIHYAVEVDTGKVPIPKASFSDASLNVNKANQGGGAK